MVNPFFYELLKTMDTKSMSEEIQTFGFPKPHICIQWPVLVQYDP